MKRIYFDLNYLDGWMIEVTCDCGDTNFFYEDEGVKRYSKCWGEGCTNYFYVGIREIVELNEEEYLKEK